MNALISQMLLKYLNILVVVRQIDLWHCLSEPKALQPQQAVL